MFERQIYMGHFQYHVLVCALLAAGIISGCTTRRVYERPANVAATAAGAININTASAEELERLPRIGPKMAAAIVAFREKNGPFQKPEELMQLHGISEKRFLELRPLLRTE
jgi:competence ComEA-like helix-hairpin-helix protein